MSDAIIGILIGAILACLFGYLCARLEYYLNDGVPPADL